jgi:hypothetical protein
MKTKILVALLGACALTLTIGCEKKEEGGGTTSTAASDTKGGGKAGGTGLAECDDMIKAMEKCPAAAKGAYEQTAKAMKDALSAPNVPDAAKEQWKTSCKTSADAIKQACP